MHRYAILFCYNVKRLRDEHNLSKKQMAKIMGVGTKTLTSIENGAIPPRASAEIILKICDHFSISPQKLFTV